VSPSSPSFLSCHNFLGIEFSVSKNIDKLMNIYYPEKKSRPMVLPVDWRTSLELDKGLTGKITLPRIPGIRGGSCRVMLCQVVTPFPA